jgi:hypothetical protein
MNTSEIFNPAQRKKRVVENFLNSHFGLKLQARGDLAQVQSMIVKLVNENHEIAASVRGYENDSRFVKNTMMIEALKQVLKEIAPMRTPRKVNEQSGEELAQAELILVAKNMVEKLQGMAEDVAQMQTDDLMPLVEKIKVEFGQDLGQQFNDAADAAFSTLLEAVKAGKDSLSQATGILTGESPAGAMPDQMGAMGAGEELPPEDEFAATDAASGEEELPTGRELK